MMPFSNPIAGAIRPQKRQLKCSGWLNFELISKEDELLGALKAQVVAFRL